MKLYEYENYDEYVAAQKKGVYHHPRVKNAINYEWIKRDEVSFLWYEIIEPYFKTQKRTAICGICHGAKLGKENMWLQEKTKIDFIGTDLICPTNDKMKLLNWDFHETKKEWKNKFDVMYTNSFDHSYDPEHCLRQWLSCLSEGGICIIEWSPGHGEMSQNEIDSLGASFQEYKTLIEKASGKIILEKQYKIKRYVVFTR
jgi:hypothetical protein